MLTDLVTILLGFNFSYNFLDHTKAYTDMSHMCCRTILFLVSKFKLSLVFLLFSE